jgi:hypothetical protein
VRIHPYLEQDVAKQLAEYSAASGIPSSAIVQAALREHLDRTGDTELILRRLDRLGRDNARADCDRGLFMEAFGVFVRLWLAYTPKLDEGAKEFARRTSETRFSQFMEHVVQRYTGGPRFLDDLPREVFADDAELSGLAAGASSPSPAEAPSQGSSDEE